MTTEQHISKLEKEVAQIQESLDELIDLVKEMNKGLYGDEKNNYVGVIKKQSDLEKSVAVLKKEIEDIKMKNLEQDIAINAKNNYKLEIVRWVKDIFVAIIQVIVIWAIIKGTIGPDALLKY